MTLWYAVLIIIIVIALFVVFNAGFIWGKDSVEEDHVRIIEGKLEDFTKGSEVIFFEADPEIEGGQKMMVGPNGTPLLVEDEEGTVGMFILVKKFKKRGES